MKRDDIKHLANLSRIELTEDEMGSLETELNSIMDYVGVVTDIASEDKDSEPQVGVVHNVFRKDEITNEPEEFTDAVIKEMPKSDGRFLSVKKILNTD